ncbi:MAG: transposase [Prosthecobacter sp.]|nr:transposase [Prosthecobacter sp.]
MADHSLQLEDESIRSEMVSDELKRQRADAARLRTTQSFYAQYFGFFSNVFSQWEICSEEDLMPVTDRARHTYITYPSGFPRHPGLHNLVTMDTTPSDHDLNQLTWVFKKMIPDRFFEHIAEKTDEALKEAHQNIRLSRGDGSIRSLRARQLLGIAKHRASTGKHGPQLRHVVPGSSDEMKRVFFASVVFQTLYSQMTAKKYFKGRSIERPDRDDPVEATKRRFGISWDRFWEIRNYMSFDHDIAETIINEGFTRWVITGGRGIAVDESLMACQSEDAPTIYISRKPHSEGLRYYLLCIKLPRTQRPFCLEVMHDLKLNDRLTVSEILERSFKHLKRSGYQLHLTADAFFGTKALLDGSIVEEDALFTMAWNRHRLKDFWSALGHGIPEHSRGHRLIYRTGGPNLIASVFYDRKEMCVLSNSFSYRNQPPTSSSDHSEDPEPEEYEEIPMAAETPEMCLEHHVVGPTLRPCAGFAYCQRALCHRCRVVTYMASQHYPLPFCSKRCLDYYRNSQSIDSQRTASHICEQLALKLSSKTLKSMCAERSLETDGTKRDLAYRYGGWEETPTLPPADVDPPPPPASESLPSSSDLSDVIPSALDSASSSSTSDSLEELRRGLENISQAEKARFIRQHGIQPSTNPIEVEKQVTFLLLNNEEKNDLVAQYLRLQESTSFYPPDRRPLLHQIYGEDFNPIDKFDRRAYDYYGRDSTKRMSWNFAAANALFAYSLVNVTSWAEEKMRESLPTQPLLAPKEFMVKILLPLFQVLAPTSIEARNK